MVDMEIDDDDFPWEFGVFDAHCHPTDTMSEVPIIPNMKAAALTIMATRGQDQSLVADVAHTMGLKHEEHIRDNSSQVIPSFGWHPWFSHQIYVDEIQPNLNSGTHLEAESKTAHYQAVLMPKPEDTDFLTALPDPISLSGFIQATENHLRQHPYALVGEIGLDRAFRLPNVRVPGDSAKREASLTPGGREGRSLSPYRVSLDHQRKILLAQLNLAGKMKRPVSVHGVQAHGILYETISETWKGYERQSSSKRRRKRLSNSLHADTDYEHAEETSQQEISQQETLPYPPRICLHSYSGSWEPIRQYVNPRVPAIVYFSFSVLVNFSSCDPAKIEKVIKAVPNDRILIESDMHVAGPEMDSKLKEIAETICALKGWDISSGIQQLAQNWKDFVFGKK